MQTVLKMCLFNAAFILWKHFMKWRYILAIVASKEIYIYISPINARHLIPLSPPHSYALNLSLLWFRYLISFHFEHLIINIVAKWNVRFIYKLYYLGMTVRWKMHFMWPARSIYLPKFHSKPKPKINWEWCRIEKQHNVVSALKNDHNYNETTKLILAIETVSSYLPLPTPNRS